MVTFATGLYATGLHATTTHAATIHGKKITIGHRCYQEIRPEDRLGEPLDEVDLGKIVLVTMLSESDGRHTKEDDAQAMNCDSQNRPQFLRTE